MWTFEGSIKFEDLKFPPFACCAASRTHETPTSSNSQNPTLSITISQNATKPETTLVNATNQSFPIAQWTTPLSVSAPCNPVVEPSPYARTGDCYRETKRATSTRFLRSIWIHTRVHTVVHTHARARKHREWQRRKRRSRASSRVDLLRVTRHCKVGEYILIFHFLRLEPLGPPMPRWIAILAVACPPTLFGERWRGPGFLPGSCQETLNHGVPRGTDYTNRWFIIVVRASFLECNHGHGAQRWRKKKRDEKGNERKSRGASRLPRVDPLVSYYSRERPRKVSNSLYVWRDDGLLFAWLG